MGTASPSRWSFGTALIRLLLVGILSCSWAKVSDGIGVNYGMLGNNLPAPKEVVQLLQTTYIDKVKIYGSNPEVLMAFSKSGITIVVGVENELIPVLAKSQKVAQVWVRQHLLPYYPATLITDIVVGNEILTGKDEKLMYQLVPAMQNLYKALVSHDIHEEIRVSTPNSMAVLASSSPPSSATFQPKILPTMKLLLQFLSETGSTFMANAYPYFAYKADPKGISLDYALFRENRGVKDAGTGLSYGNLFDAQVDAIYFAMKAAGYEGLPVVVSETGWPSHGDANEAGAGMENAQEYNGNLVKRLRSNLGTPYKPKVPIDTYIFALFNENLKPGPSSERNFGLFQPSKASVYDAGVSKGTREPSPYTPTPVTGAPATPSPKTPVSGGQPSSPSGVWCVAAPTANEELLQQNLNFACGEGGADCGAIQPGESCFNPNTLAAHASYAMNSYYQRHGRNYWNCFANNAGLLTTTNPSYGSCNYPSQ